MPLAIRPSSAPLLSRADRGVLRPSAFRGSEALQGTRDPRCADERTGEPARRGSTRLKATNWRGAKHVKPPPTVSSSMGY